MNRVGQGSGNILLPFVDLMLCAVGCGLIIFVGMLVHPHGRGGGWHDKPLLIQSEAEAGPVFGGFHCTWSLKRVGEAAGVSAGVARPESYPEDRMTVNRQLVLFVVPEAEFGSWSLSLVAKAEMDHAGNLARLVPRQASRTDFISPRDASFCDSYEQMYRRYLGVLRPNASRESRVDLLQDLQQARWQDIHFIATGSSTKARDDVAAYLEFRRRAMIAQVAARLRPEFAAHRQLALTALEPYRNPPAEGDYSPEIHYSRRNLVFAFAFDYALLQAPDERAPPEAGRVLDAELVKTAPGPRMSGQRRAEGFYIWRNELIRWRALLEQEKTHQPPAGTDYRKNLEAVFAAAPKDFVCQLVLAELRALTGGEQSFVVRLRVRWGYRQGVLAGAGAQSTNDPVFDDDWLTVRFLPKDLGGEVPVATIVLDRDHTDARIMVGPR
jgi:hypothetical protein